MTPIVVTGGFGYVGGRIVQTLLEGGADVRVSTRRDAQRIPAWARDRVRWSSDLDILCAGANAIIHLAAPNEIRAAAEPERTIRDTVDLTDRALVAAQRAGLSRFFYFSTVHVYGRLAGNISEQTPADPQHPYAIAHHESEKLIASSAGKSLQTLILRLSNGYGAPADAGAERWTLLVNDLCRQAVYEGGLTLSSSGRQWRDFIPLSDVAQATRHLLALPSLTACPDVINLSLGASMTVREMAGLILERARLMVQSDLALDIADHSAEPDYPPLTISNQRLLQSGFAFSADTAREIDGLLRFCMDTLSPQH